MRKTKKALSPTKSALSPTKSALFADTLTEAITAGGWRKTIVGLAPPALARLEALIASVDGVTPGATAGSAATTARALGYRRVVILIEPERGAGVG